MCEKVRNVRCVQITETTLCTSLICISMAISRPNLFSLDLVSHVESISQFPFQKLQLDPNPHFPSHPTAPNLNADASTSETQYPRTRRISKTERRFLKVGSVLFGRFFPVVVGGIYGKTTMRKSQRRSQSRLFSLSVESGN